MPFEFEILSSTSPVETEWFLLQNLQHLRKGEHP